MKNTANDKQEEVLHDKNKRKRKNRKRNKKKKKIKKLKSSPAILKSE